MKIATDPPKLVDLKLTRFIPGPPADVFDVWFDPALPGGPWHGAKKVMMTVAVDAMFYFGIERPVASASGLLGHFGRFTAVDRPHAAEHTWMSEFTHGLESIVAVTFEARDSGTQLTILHRGVPDDEAGRRHEAGWTSLLARLDRYFAEKS